MTSSEELNPDQPLRQLKGIDRHITNEKLIVLATFSNATDAHMLCNSLEANGIASRVSNECSNPIFGVTIAVDSSAFYVEVLVLASDAERALIVKNEHLANKNESEIPEWQCECGELVDSGFAVCWNCESEYPEHESQ